MTKLSTQIIKSLVSLAITGLVLSHSTHVHAQSTLQGLVDLPGGAYESIAYDINHDGTVVIGYGTNSSGAEEAFRWTSGTGMVGLGDLPGGSFSSGATAISADGEVIVGYVRNASGAEAFRWTSATGMVGLGDFAGGSFSSRASDANADGSVIVGNSVSANGFEAFRWTQEDGMIRVEDWLTNAGVDVSNFIRLSNAEAVSDDGTIIVGAGSNISGDFEAFLARVSPFRSGILDPVSSARSIAELDGLESL